MHRNHQYAHNRVPSPLPPSKNRIQHPQPALRPGVVALAVLSISTYRENRSLGAITGRKGETALGGEA